MVKLQQVMSPEKSRISSGIVRGLHTLLTVSIALSMFVTNTGKTTLCTILSTIKVYP